MGETGWLTCGYDMKMMLAFCGRAGEVNRMPAFGEKIIGVVHKVIIVISCCFLLI